MKNYLIKFASLAALVLMIIASAFTPNHEPKEIKAKETTLEKAKTIELTFVDHLKAGLIEQDVFIEKEAGSGQVYRVLPEEREQYLDNEIFATKEMQKHNPFSKAEAGPFEKGKSMDMTLREWLTAKGSANYSCQDGWGVMTASFENLMPNGTYTMWHAFMAKPPADPFPGFIELPIGNRDGSEALFTTDAEGNAELDLRFETCLQLTENQLVGLLAIAFHSDGKTYGVNPGPFGQVTHVQLFTMLPDSDDIEG